MTDEVEKQKLEFAVSTLFVYDIITESEKDEFIDRIENEIISK